MGREYFSLNPSASHTLPAPLLLTPSTPSTSKNTKQQAVMGLVLELTSLKIAFSQGHNKCLLSAMPPTWSSTVAYLFLVSVIKTWDRFKEIANSQKTLHSALNCNQLGSWSLPAGPLQTDWRNNFVNRADCALCMLGQYPTSGISYVILGSKSNFSFKSSILDMLYIPQQLLRRKMIQKISVFFYFSCTEPNSFCSYDLYNAQILEISFSPG